MPSNKEIAGWLREAAEIAEFHSTEARVRFLKRATLVERMRCETCKWYDDSYPGSRFGECLNKETRRETNCDLLPDREFLCRHWEGNDA